MIIASSSTKYTPDDLLTMPDGDRYALVDGQLVELNISGLSSLVGDFFSLADLAGKGGPGP